MACLVTPNALTKSFIDNISSNFSIKNPYVISIHYIPQSLTIVNIQSPYVIKSKKISHLVLTPLISCNKV
jgi:hypothetical protein